MNIQRIQIQPGQKIDLNLTEAVVLVGTKKALATAVRRADTGQRNTTLRKWLQEA